MWQQSDKVCLLQGCSGKKGVVYDFFFQYCDSVLVTNSDWFLNFDAGTGCTGERLHTHCLLSVTGHTSDVAAKHISLSCTTWHSLVNTHRTQVSNLELCGLCDLGRCCDRQLGSHCSPA